MFVRSPVRILARLLLCGLLGSACQSARPVEPVPVPRGAIERLRELQPVDIAVAPVRDETNAQRVPLDVFREAFIASLVERRYSPLAPSYVDANWVEAAFKGTPAPDALLVVNVTAWDPTHLYSTGRVTARADLVLFEGGDTTGKVLWQVALDESVDMGDGRGRPPAAGRDLIPQAVRKLAQRALQALPMRDPVAARKSEAPAEVR